MDMDKKLYRYLIIYGYSNGYKLHTADLLPDK